MKHKTKYATMLIAAGATFLLSCNQPQQKEKSSTSADSSDDGTWVANYGTSAHVTGKLHKATIETKPTPASAKLQDDTKKTYAAIAMQE